MSITILSRPYDGLGTLPKINPVYNGLGFAVSSNNNKSPNFKYIAEVFINGTKVGQLSHNPDITNGNIGIFDIGRIVENYISYNLNWNIKTTTAAGNSLVDYHIEFGEEFSRIGNVKNVQNSLGKARIETMTPHGLETNDRVQIQGSLYTGYNGYSIVKYITPTAFSLNGGFITSNVGSDMYFVSGESILQFMSYVGADSKQYVRLKVKANTGFNIGNIITVALDGAYSSWIGAYENVDWTVVKTTPYSSYSYIDTNIPFQTTIPSNYTGSVISRGNFFKRNLLSTKNDLAKAFNGVEQYETWTDWTPYPYIFTRSEFEPVPDPYGQLGKFLTKRPRTETKVCFSDYMVLSAFGKNNFYNTPASNMSTYYIIETLSTPAPPAMPTEILLYGGRTTFRLPGGTPAGAIALAKEWTAGSLLTLFGWYWNGSAYVAIHTNCYIATVLGNGNDLLISVIGGYGGTPEQWFITATGTFVFAGWSSSLVLDPTRQWNATMKVKTSYNKMGGHAMRNEGPAGPKNLEALYEFANKRVYKYMIYHVKAVSSQEWYNYEKFSEIMTFTLDCKCSKFKKHTLMWLNDLGGWDFYYFNLKSDIEREIDRSQFHRHLKSYSTGNGYRYNGGDRGRTTYNTTSNDKITVRSEYLTQGELDWMANLLESPEVYWIKNTTKNDTVAGVWTNNIPVDKLIPVNITNSSFELFNKTNVNKDTGTLYIYDLTFQAALNRGVQRGGATSLPVAGATTPVIVNPGVTPNGPWSPNIGGYDDWRSSRNNWDYFYNRS